MHILYAASRLSPSGAARLQRNGKIERIAARHAKFREALTEMARRDSLNILRVEMGYVPRRAEAKRVMARREAPVFQ